ncbi:hypothetical protein, variant 1 [Aphanomyces astaci]|uniref:PX domain-containing protein n=1 Tax=Aphanomyces astaci TaxID=112090 RepID=W4FYG2_APHAT|nr:hypothetical protein, variant 1 [Aphanomyces astaci]ETV71698.1 hypothetical protein, variant 1 [Aphanomyces astaci]|eukprot:XP_009838887.1 hypothetical protein, variant 1 [Aphanomyces astaci]
MQVVCGLLRCYTGSCFGEEHHHVDRLPSDRHACPQLFKLKSLVVRVPSCNSVLRLESTNCKIACLPTGLVKKVVFMYLRGRHENAITASIDTTDEETSDDDDASSSGESYPRHSQIPLTVTSSITSYGTSMNEAYAFARTGFPDDIAAPDHSDSSSVDLKVLQDTYLLTFRKGTAAKDKDLVQVKLFMVNKSPTHDNDMKIVHVLLSDRLWVDIVVSDASYATALSFDTSEILESHTVFQLCRCDLNECSCDDGSPLETIWRRQEDTRMDECVAKKRRRYVWHDQPPPTSAHKCTVACDAATLPELHLTLVVAADVCLHAEFELTLTSSKRVQDLSDHVYTVFCIRVCHGDLKWHITRRFRDFSLLRDQLAQELHATDLPSLPPKTWLPTSDAKFIQARQMRLETYLRQLSGRPDAMQSVAFLSFLGALSSPRLEHEWISGVPRDVLHLRILQRCVETGDVLLFQSKNHMSGVQRTMTGAEWDHVGMVVQAPASNALPKFLLLEATGDGVTLLPLVPRILAYNSCFINYIALRKLRMPPVSRDTFHRRMHAFVALVYGVLLPKIWSFVLILCQTYYR